MKIIANTTKLLTLFCLSIFFLFLGASPAHAALNYNEVYTSPTGSKGVLVFIDNGIFSSLYDSSEFKTWITDLEKLDYKLQITQIISGTSSELRNYLVNYYNGRGLVGTVMIGDVPYANYEMYGTFGGAYNEQFPIDLFFMDMDGIWQDTDGDGVYDTHTGDRIPEIWLGRMKTSTLIADTTRSEVDKLKYYFYKTHQYRTGNLRLNKRALAYNDDDWSFYTSVSLDSIYPNVTVVNNPAETNKTDYKDNRLSGNYEWIHVMVHSSPFAHYFRPDPGYMSYEDIISKDPLANFYNLFACSNVEYTFNNYMGGHYVFNRTYGLAAVGSTKIGSMLNYGNFYPHLSLTEAQSIGEAFKNWFRAQNLSWDALGYRDWFYGMTIIGDPTLTLFPATTPTLSPTPTFTGTPTPKPTPTETPTPKPTPTKTPTPKPTSTPTLKPTPSPKPTNPPFGNGWYTNLCGGKIPPTSYSDYKCGATCLPQKGYCTGILVRKYVCDKNLSDCTMGTSGFRWFTSTSNGTVNLVSSNQAEKCNQTVKLEVRDKKDKVTGYMVWYSGLCKK